MKNFLLGAFLFLAVSVFPTSIFADQTMTQAQSTQGHTLAVGHDLRHAYQPFQTQNGDVRARINNVTMNAQNKLVCVEAWNNASNVKTHLGCLTMNWNQNNNNVWSQEFDTPTNKLGSGNYSVQYSYQDTNGMWHGIVSMDDNVTHGNVTK